MKKIMQTFLVVAISIIVPIYADKIADAIQKTEQDLETARKAMVAGSQFRGFNCVPGIFTDNVHAFNCDDRINDTTNKAAANQYVTSKKRLLALKKIAQLTAQGKLTLLQLLKQEHGISTWEQYMIEGIRPPAGYTRVWFRGKDLGNVVDLFEMKDSLFSTIDNSPTEKQFVIDLLQ